MIVSYTSNFIKYTNEIDDGLQLTPLNYNPEALLFPEPLQILDIECNIGSTHILLHWIALQSFSKQLEQHIGYTCFLKGTIADYYQVIHVYKSMYNILKRYNNVLLE